MTKDQVLAKHLRQAAVELHVVVPTSDKGAFVLGSGTSFPLAAVKSVFKEASEVKNLEAAIDSTESKWINNHLNNLYKWALAYRLEHRL